jgi:small-conductance mechanosensitive channel
MQPQSQIPQPQQCDRAGEPYAPEFKGRRPEAPERETPELEAPELEAPEQEILSGDLVQQARDRLARAVAALEDAAESVDARSRRQQRELDEARAEAEALRASQNALSARLDAAIERLRVILGE